MIKVNEKEIPFQEGMSVSQAVDLAGIVLEPMNLVMVNGYVLPPSSIKDELVKKGTVIRVLTLYAGG